MRIARTSCLTLALMLTFLLQQTYADVTLHKLFQDRLVLQREVHAPVWGWADAGEQVTVECAGQTKSATADADGNWLIRFDPLEVGGPYRMTVRGSNTIELNDVVVGDVWLASGQSNMVRVVRYSAGAQEIMERADYNNLRLFEVARNVSAAPKRNINGHSWNAAKGRAVGNFSAVAYGFAEKLHRDLDIPIGVITCAVGATMLEHWTAPQVLDSDPLFQEDGVLRWKKWKQNWKYDDLYPDPQNDIEGTFQKAFAEMQRINRARAIAKRNGETLPGNFGKDYPIHKAAWKIYKRVPSGLYNAMLKPLIPFGIKGVIWYQGESNDDHPELHARLLPTMIQSWRDEWGYGDFPFLIVSLAAFRAVPEKPVDSNWARIREAHWNTQNILPNVGTALAIDLGNADDIHPKRKEPVGRRLALIALAKTYGKEVVYSGPVFDSMEMDADAVRITFRHAHGGLQTSDGEPPRTFALAGEDREFQWADATIEGPDTIRLRSAGVPNPVAVRYAWSDNPDVNLYNAANLPAAPFRTDDWPKE